LQALASSLGRLQGEIFMKEEFTELLHKKVIIVMGSAGTGKTHLIKKLCKETGLKPTATTWAAASLTSGETYYRADRLNARFLNTEAKVIKKSHKVCIIDEASMLSQEKFDWLLTKYPNRKWILIGDWNQLPPVDGTAINISKYPIIELTKQFRFADEGIGRLVQAIKDANSFAVSKIIKNCIFLKALMMIFILTLFICNTRIKCDMPIQK
jgi:ATP-dependent exoDNAse (exonuclease V) alpha subunit